MEGQDDPADMKKVDEINKIGERWVEVECDSLEDMVKVDHCKRVQDICYSYAEDVFKLREKTDSCQNFLEDSPYNNARFSQYEVCMKGVERSLKTLIDTYYDRFNQAESNQSS